MIDHCLSVLQKEQEQKAYEFYVSEILRSLNNSIVKAIGGSEFTKSFDELKNYKPETRTGEEIKNHILNKMKKMKEGD